MIITLTTDFGVSDHFVGVMKGVILSIAPQAQIVDLNHGVPAYDIVAGAVSLEASCRFFPHGTIHVAVVDPGVGSSREAIAVKTEDYVFVGPDNGLLELALRAQKSQQIVKLTNPQYRLANVSATFHGRDLFAPAAAHIAAGVPLQELGDPIQKIASLAIPNPKLFGESLETYVLSIDHFGNAITAFTEAEFQRWNTPSRSVSFRAGESEIRNICRTYADVAPGEPLIYFGSGGRLEIAVRNGRASDVLKLAAGTRILISKL
jgi:S-adenosyl-L-methionine hydrolase (adenosine-forming)